VTAFDDADGVVNSNDGVEFSWDEEHIVRVDAPSDLQGAFDTNQFYKIEDATIARPIKQPYMDDGEVKWYKKPADELRRAAWSFDNSAYTIDHPNTGMVKDVNDVHGFWRAVRYDDDEDRLRGDLYIPSSDEDALEYIEEHRDVSAGYYNRVVTEYDGDTGDLTDDDVDGFQVDMYGNHVASVERGRCSSAQGCGLDDEPTGNVVMEVTPSTDQTTMFEGQEMMTSDFSEGDRVQYNTEAIVAHNPSDEDVIMLELLDMDGERTDITVTAQPSEVSGMMMTDAPSGIHMSEDGGWYGVAPNETSDDEPKYELDNCNDVKDAWNLRGSGDYEIEQSTLEARIKRAADAHGCASGSKPWETTDNNDNMTDSTDDDGFDIPDLSIDALTAKNDKVADLKAERDSLKSDLDAYREKITEAIDNSPHIQMDDDECVCDAAKDVIEDFDAAAERVESLEDELSEYREEEKEEILDELTELGADRDEWADESFDDIEEEIERREEVLDTVDKTSVKNVDTSTDKDKDDDTERTMNGTRKFERGYGA
jgi:hypothetical protein